MIGPVNLGVMMCFQQVDLDRLSCLKNHFIIKKKCFGEMMKSYNKGTTEWILWSLSQMTLLRSMKTNYICLCVILSLNDVEKCDIEQDLVTIVPGIKSSISCIVVKHGYVKVLVMKRNVRVLICRGFGGI